MQNKMTEKQAIANLRFAVSNLKKIGWKSIELAKVKEGLIIEGLTSGSVIKKCQWAGQPQNGRWVDAKTMDRAFPVYFKEVK